MVLAHVGVVENARSRDVVADVGVWHHVEFRVERLCCQNDIADVLIHNAAVVLDCHLDYVGEFLCPFRVLRAHVQQVHKHNA